MESSIFEAYCSYVLDASNAAQGRYGKEDLRRHIMILPNCRITMAARDLMVEEVPIIPTDVSLRDFIREKVISPAVSGHEWEMMPCMIDTKVDLAKWDEWKALDSEFMPMGLEPALVICGEYYQYEGNTYRLADIRFLPLKSYAYRKART